MEVRYEISKIQQEIDQRLLDLDPDQKNEYEQMKNKYKEKNERLVKEKNELIRQLKEMNNINNM